MDLPVSIPIRNDGSVALVRGVGWVMRRALAALLLGMAAVVLLDFAYRLAAERELMHAARAGAREIALPRSSRRSVEQVIRRRLDSKLNRDVHVSLAPIDGSLRLRLSAPADAALPDWLQLVTFWNATATVAAEVRQ